MLTLRRLTAASLTLGFVLGGTAVATSTGGSSGLIVSAVSTRADLVTGGDVLLEVRAPAGVRPLTVTVEGRDVTAAFTTGRDRALGLVTGLRLGRSTVVATVGRASARLDVTNHRVGGPLFSGRQIEPWRCETEAAGLGPPRDADCNAPAKVEYFYKPPVGSSLLAYDPAAPPPVVATTTTDQGRTVPFIVRKETGTLNRSVYTTAVLWDPARRVDPRRPSAWNGKLFYRFDGGAAPNHRQGSAPADVMQVVPLGRGFAVASSTLNVFGQNTNTVTSAETMMMVKERVAEQLGKIRYTLSSGGSGGSIQQQTIANAYPGLLDGITVAVSFTDLVTTAQEATDCSLLVRYFTETSPHLWADPLHQAAVNGHESLSGCVAWDKAFNLDQTAYDPRVGCVAGTANPAPQTPEAEFVYDPQNNPRGARCTLQDYASNIFGRRSTSVWSPVERRIRTGFANRPYDNTGVQYGLDALRSGVISTEQFVDLNEKIGGYDIDRAWQPRRSAADPAGVAAAYRASQVNDAGSLDRIPIIDTRVHLNAEIHTQFRSWSMRARLDAANGHHANQTIWTFDPGSSESSMTAKAFDVLDAWLAAIERDRTGRTQADKVVANKPAEAADACFVQALRIDDQEQCDRLFPYYGNPRIAAGGPVADDNIACARVPLRRAAYPAGLSDDQWARLRAVFPDGVCDYTRPARDRRSAVAWLAFPAPGGVALGPPPTSTTGRGAP